MKSITQTYAHKTEKTPPQKASYQKISGEAAELRGFNVIKVLLTHILAFFGTRFRSREAYREHCYRVRAAVRDVRLVEAWKVHNKKYMASWSGDSKLHWNKRMWTVWNYSRADHLPPFRWLDIAKLDCGGTRPLEQMRTAQAFAGLCDNMCVPAPP